MRSRETWALLAGAALLTAGCTSAPAETTTTSTPVTTTSTPSTTTTEPVPTSTTSAPSTTTTTVAVRLPANDVDDPTEAIVAIFEYLSYLHTIPGTASQYLNLIYTESCDCYGEVLTFFDDYAARGWTQDDDGIVVEEAIVTQEFQNGNVLLQVTDSWTPQYVRDEGGGRIRLLEDEWTSEVSLVGLERGSDGRWRVGVIGVIGQQSS